MHHIYLQTLLTFSSSTPLMVKYYNKVNQANSSYFKIIWSYDEVLFNCDYYRFHNLTTHLTMNPKFCLFIKYIRYLNLTYCQLIHEN